MTLLEQMLRGDRPHGVLRGNAAPAGHTIEELAIQYGWLVRQVALEGVADKHEFIEAWAAALDFPSWHGKNWDAFEELLGDLSWLPESNGVIVRISGLQANPPDAVEMGMRIVEESIANRRQEQLPLVVIAG
jgi:hypothetical protein